MKFILLLTILSLFPVISVTAQSKNDAKTRDEKVNIGSYSLYMKCAGTGSPTVILEAGLASPSSDWDKVFPEVAKITRVCAYDRANIGKSDAAPKPRTVRQITDDLHALLEKSGEKAPFVLVGHSFGGIYSVFYANGYPKDIAGMVLVDSSHEDQVLRFEAIMTPQQLQESRARRSVNGEGVDTTEIRNQLRALKWRTDIPLYVLVHGKNMPDMIPPGWTAEQVAQRNRAWLELQTDFAKRSPNGKLITAKESGHYIQNDEPQVVIDAVKKVVKQARKKMKKAGK